MFAGLYALVIGLIGAAWRIAAAGAPASVPVREESARPTSSTQSFHRPEVDLGPAADSSEALAPSIVTLPVIAMTLLGAIYVVAFKAPVYWAPPITS